MANLRNEFEFRSALLTALGQEHTEAEAKNEEMWRRKMLDGLGVEYDQNDVNQFGLFREKLIEGVTSKSEGGGGGGSDFSTATVTFNSNTAETIQLMVPVATEEGIDIELAVRNGRTLEVPLYNGSCIVSPNDSFVGDITAFSVTGDISIDAEAGNIIVSGDGTITFDGGSDL